MAVAKVPHVIGAWYKKNFGDLLSSSNSVHDAPIIKHVTQYKGELPVYFEPLEIISLVPPFKLTFVGKFSHGKTSIEALCKEFHKVGFKGSFLVGWIDPWHIFVHFDLEEDYLQFWMKGM